MSTENRPYWGKDGNHYSDYYEMQAANTRYEQKERLIQEQKEANRLAKEQKEIQRNGGYTDNEMIVNTIIVAVFLKISKHIIKKGYQSEVSMSIIYSIFIFYVVDIIIAIIAATSGWGKYIPMIIGTMIIIHIYLKVCIYFMEKSIRKNSKNVKVKENASMMPKEEVVEDEHITINLNGKVEERQNNNISSNYSETDPLLEDVIKAIIESGQTSATFLEKKFGIEHDKAKKIIDLMEDMGIISKSNGSEPRKILVTKEQMGFSEKEVLQLEHEPPINNKLNISYEDAKEVINRLENIGAISNCQDGKPRQVLVNQEQWEELKKKL